MVICDRQGEQLLLTLSPEGVRFLREQWSWLRELVRWQLAGCTDDPLAEVTGLPVPIGTIDGRLAYVVDYWCGTQETGLVRKLWEGWVLHDLEHSLTRVLGTAWLLGAATATSGSMIAVNQLAHGLLDAQAQAQQLGGRPVSADLEPTASNSDASPSPSAAPAKHARTPAAKVTPSAGASSNAASSGSGGGGSDGSDGGQASGSSQAPSSGSSQAPSSGSSSPAGTLLVSSGGSVTATCESAGAYLLYWSPDQGYEADDVYRGPAATASVLFQGTSASVLMRVTCSGGKPVAHVYPGTDE